jgi:hypothetical protein
MTTSVRKTCPPIAKRYMPVIAKDVLHVDIDWKSTIDQVLTAEELENLGTIPQCVITCGDDLKSWFRRIEINCESDTYTDSDGWSVERLSQSNGCK